MTKTAIKKKDAEKTCLSERMKASDLIDLNFHLLGVLSRMGISLGFGEATVQELCRRHGVDVNTFLLVCNVYTFDDYVPSEETLDSLQAADIVRYLRLSHSYYTDSALKTLEASIEKMLRPCGETYRKIIRKFFTDYKNELERHFDFEEKHVFPYVEALLSGNVTGDNGLTDMEEGHHSIGEKIGDLKNIVMKYLPAGCDSSDIREVLFYIYYLEADLARHTAIEDGVLMPMINRLEYHE